MVEDGRAPLGLLATAVRRGYVEAWLIGGAGTLHIYIPQPQVVEMEAASAAAALDKEVVIDGSTLAVLSLIPDVAPKLLASFARAQIPSSLRIDAVTARDRLSSPSEGVLSWDLEAHRPRMVTFRPDEVAAWRQRAGWVEDMAIDLSSVAVEQFPDLPDADPETWFWLASLQLAKSTGLALYCDDAWMRRLAASLGTPAFGTVDLLNVLVAEGRIATADRDGCISVLREHRAVSIPIEAEDLAVLAAVDSSPTGLAILQVAQSGFWTDPRAGQTFEALLTQIVRQDAAHLPEWMGAGMLGATRSARESVRTEILSGFLAAAISHYTASKEVASCATWRTQGSGRGGYVGEPASGGGRTRAYRSILCAIRWSNQLHVRSAVTTVAQHDSRLMLCSTSPQSRLEARVGSILCDSE